MRHAEDMPLALVTELVEWLRPFFETFGYLIVPVAMFLESAALTGIVVPGDVILAVGGVYAAEGALALPLVIALGWFGSLLGETIGFLLGRRYGDALLHRVPFVDRFEDRIEELKGSIEANAGKTIVVGRFVTGAGGLVPFVAGTSRVRPLTFFAYTIPTLLVWATAISLLGYFVGNHVETIDRILSTVGWVGLGLVVLLVGFWIWRRRRSSEGEKEGASASRSEAEDG
jgi:membrane protein DedA with SNARE-associated domain